MLLIAALVWNNDKQVVPASPEPTPVAAQKAAEVAEPVEMEPAPIADAPEEAETYVTLDDQLAMARELSRASAALTTLFSIWNIDLSAATLPACEHAQSLGYSCLNDRSSWSGLRRLNRPAVLELVDQSGDAHYVVLTAIRGDRAELSIGGVSVSHPVSVVADMWFGDYQLLWQPPNGISVSLLPGMQDPSVVWLRESLAFIDQRYRAEPFDSDVYDQALTQQVRAFQRDQRLDVDGLAGKQTQIIINSLLESDNTPRLTMPQLAQE
jgi:general secretion pathway protein A